MIRLGKAECILILVWFGIMLALLLDRGTEVVDLEAELEQCGKQSSLVEPSASANLTTLTTDRGIFL